MLEFAALLRFVGRSPGWRARSACQAGCQGAILIGVLPAALLVASVVRGERETVLGMSSAAFGSILIVLGVAAYAANCLIRPRGWTVAAEPEASA